MALPYLIKDSDIRFIEKWITASSKWIEHDLCLLAFFVGTPCTILELNRITISDVMNSEGKIKKSFVIRGDKAFNGECRVVYIKEHLKKYIAKYLRCIDDVFKNEFLFRTLSGQPFSITTLKGNQRADSLSRHILDILRESGIEQPSALSGRRTFATKANNNGVHVSVIHHLLGNKTLITTKRLIDSDPLTMGALSAKAY